VKIKSLAIGTLILALAASATFAQYVPGRQFIGGSVAMYGASPGDGSLEVSPTIGTTISNDMIIGVATLFYVPPFGADYTLGVSPFVRWFRAVGERAGGFAQIGPSYQYSALEGEVTGLTLGVFGLLGGYYFVTPKVSVEAVLGEASYYRTSLRLNGEEVNDSSRWAVGLFTTNLALSLYYHF
jgi:hypothetical protein